MAARSDRSPASTIHRPGIELGQDVKGLEDLPVKEILTKIKEALPQAVERAGLLSGEAQSGNWEITWGLQHYETRIAARKATNGVVIDICQAAPATDPQQGAGTPTPRWPWNSGLAPLRMDLLGNTMEQVNSPAKIRRP
ncbi:MAG: hypothetical protein U0894_14765 [Pirellulales bacterium]